MTPPVAAASKTNVMFASDVPTHPGLSAYPVHRITPSAILTQLLSCRKLRVSKRRGLFFERRARSAFPARN